MRIEFTPSEKTIAIMKHMHELRQKGVWWDDIAKEVGLTKRYAMALYKKYKEMKGIT